MNTPSITTAAPQAGNATRATPQAGPHAEPAVPGIAGRAGRAAGSAKSRRSIDPHAGSADVAAQDVDPATAPAAPLYLGIDVAKAELVAATRADGRVLHTRAYANNAAGICKLLRHDALVRQRGDAQRRLQSGACAHVADTWRRMEAYLNAEIARLHAAMEAHIAADKKLAQHARLLRSIPGIGAGNAATALGVIDFAQFDSADQLAAYIGVCPSRKQSGPSAGSARISKQGQALLRRQLYMAALAAVRHNPPIQHAAARWQSAHTKGNGRPLTPKQTVCAAMHKLARQMFGVVKRGQPYQADWRSRRAPTNHSTANTAPATDAPADANAGADVPAGQPATATDTSSPAHPIAA